MKNQKGITLIALVITIIVLLILAGVSIAMLTGENGILTQATDAAVATDKAAVIESIDMELMALYGYKAANGTITPEQVAQANSNVADYKVDGASTEIFVLSGSDSNITVTSASVIVPTDATITLTGAGISGTSVTTVDSLN